MMGNGGVNEWWETENVCMPGMNIEKWRCGSTVGNGVNGGK